jgi:hypothetical protein
MKMEEGNEVGSSYLGAIRSFMGRPISLVRPKRSI